MQWTWVNKGVAPCYPGGFPTLTLKDADGGIVSLLVDETLNLRDLKDRRQELAQMAETLARYEGLTGDISALRGQIDGLEDRLQAARTNELHYRSVNQMRAATGRKTAIEAELAMLPEAKPFPADGISRLNEIRASLDSVREQINTGDLQAAESESALDQLGVVEPFIVD